MRAMGFKTLLPDELQAPIIVTFHMPTKTELGRISKLVTEAEAQQTPLEKRLNTLGRRLAWVVLAIGLFIALIGVLLGRDTYLSIEVGIALAVAAVSGSNGAKSKN